MRHVLVLLFSISVAFAQTGAIQGTVLDSKTQKPIPTAIVIARLTGTPPLARDTRSGGAGEFQLPGLPAGKYSICVQVPGDRYLDPCQWNGNQTTVTVTAGQTSVAVTLRLSAASVLNIQLQDPQNVLSQKTKDGRRPDLTLGVWGPKGLYYPAHGSGPSGVAAAVNQTGKTYAYRLAVPLDTALNFHIASHDVKLGDANGVSLPSNASQQAFQHATGDPNPKSFAFTVLGLLP